VTQKRTDEETLHLADAAGVLAIDDPVGEVALRFQSKDDLVRCLDIVSELGGLACEVVPWTTVIGPSDLIILCEKQGIPIRVAKVVSSNTPRSEKDEKRRLAQMLRVAKNLERATRER